MIDPFRELCQDLTRFHNEVVNIMEKDAEYYDKNLKNPFWRQTDCEDYLNHLAANVAKFNLHADLLQQADNIFNEDANQKTLIDLSAHLVEQIAIYPSDLKNQTLGIIAEKALYNLKKIKQLINEFQLKNRKKPNASP